MSHQFKGLPFRLVSATPIDLFPHTPHCEVVFLLERITKDELKTENAEAKTIKANSMKKSETHEAATTDNMNPGSREVEEITMCNVETNSQDDKTTTKSESPKVIASDSNSTSEYAKIIDKAIGGDVKSNPPKAKDSVKLWSSEVNAKSESQEIEATGTSDGISDSQEVKLNSETD